MELNFIGIWESRDGMKVEILNQGRTVNGTPYWEGHFLDGIGGTHKWDKNGNGEIKEWDLMKRLAPGFAQ